MLQKYRKKPVNQLVFQGRIGRPTTLLQPNAFTEDFKRVCFKRKERKYYYGRTSANENVKQKWQVQIKFKRHMSNLDVFL